MRNGNHQYESGREDKGNAILSTLPLSDAIAIELPFEAQRKMAVAATVHLGNDSLRAVSAHLDVSATLFRTVVEGNSTRARQALGLLQGLAMAEGLDPAATPGGAPDPEAVHPIATVMGGDFNTWSARETAIRLLRDDFPESPPYDGQPSRGLFPTDFLFFRAGGDGRIELSGNRYRLVEDLYYSDHHALIAWLKVRGDGRSAVHLRD
jgi:endonuclease/exonuclease/phosphatase family metal-dependent hydrolase